MVIDKLSDEILLQWIIIALTTTSINGTHSIENLVVPAFPNSLHNIAAAKLCGVDRGEIRYIPDFSHLNLLEQDLQFYMTSIGSSFSLEKFLIKALS